MKKYYVFFIGTSNGSKIKAKTHRQAKKMFAIKNNLNEFQKSYLKSKLI